jgi:hypothetical protein
MPVSQDFSWKNKYFVNYVKMLCKLDYVNYVYGRVPLSSPGSRYWPAHIGNNNILKTTRPPLQQHGFAAEGKSASRCFS